MRAEAVITDSEREPLPSYFDNVEWTQNSRAARVKELRNSSGQRVRKLVHLLQFLPADAETVKLDHFIFEFRRFRFLRRHWRGCGSSRDVHVDKETRLHKLLHRGLVKSGNTFHTVNILRDRGLRVFKCKRLWKAAMVSL